MRFLFALCWGGLVLAGRPLLATEAVAQDRVITFTAEERAWMAGHPVIRVGLNASHAPYTIRENTGRLVGINPDYLAIFSRRTGLRFETAVRDSWPQMLEAFKAQEIDLLFSLSRDTRREGFMTYTDTYAFAPDVIITRNDSPYLFSLRDLKGRRISIPRGFAGPREQLKENAPDSVAVEYDNPLECYKAVASGEVFASIGDAASASYLIKANQLTSLRLGNVLFNNPNMYIGARKDWPMLVSITNKVLASITTEERQQIYNRWIAVDFSADRWWLKAFKILAVVAAVVLVVFLFVVFHNRSLAAELAERRRIQLQLEETHEQLARVSEEKSELMRMVAHDLRSPLTGFGMGAELLQAESAQLSGSAREILAKMINATGLMRRMVDDLVDVQMMEEGRLDYQAAPVDFGGLLREAMAAFAETAAHKQIRLALRNPEPGANLLTDAKALRRAVDNLLSNALKYSPHGTEVVLEVRRTGDVWRLTICDQGLGVKPEEREKIFEKYRRGSALPTGGEKSTGLGLWIVRRIVTALHGRVWCEAGPGAVGSAFVVELPLAPPAAG